MKTLFTRNPQNSSRAHTVPAYSDNVRPKSACKPVTSKDHKSATRCRTTAVVTADHKNDSKNRQGGHRFYNIKLNKNNLITIPRIKVFTVSEYTTGQKDALKLEGFSFILNTERDILSNNCGPNCNSVNRVESLSINRILLPLSRPRCPVPAGGFSPKTLSLP